MNKKSNKMQTVYLSIQMYSSFLNFCILLAKYYFLHLEIIFITLITLAAPAVFIDDESSNRWKSFADKIVSQISWLTRASWVTHNLSVSASAEVMVEEARKNLLTSRLESLKQGKCTDCVFLVGSEDKEQASIFVFSIMQKKQKKT